MITRRISKSGGGDHASIASFNSYMNGLGTMTDDVTAEVWHNGTSADELTDGPIVFSVTPAGYKLYIQPKSGEGFADRSDPSTDALVYDNTRGACITGSTAVVQSFSTGCPIILTGMQLKNTASSGLVVTFDPNDCAIEGCILENANAVGASGYVVDVSSNNLIFRRNLLIARGCLVMLRLRGATSQNIAGNSLLGLSGTNTFGIFGDGATGTLYNNWVHGCATDASIGSMTGSHNATDSASGGLPSTNRQNSVVLADEVENTTNDFRLKSTSAKLRDNGTAQGRATDIYGSSDSGARDIGAFEFQGVVLAPEITVTGNGNAITDGDTTPSATDHTDFGSITQGGSTVSRTFTVANPGTATLNISSVTVPTGYTKTTDLPSTIAASGNAGLVVRLDNTPAGTKSGDITILHDAVGSPFNFAVTGIVSAAPPPPPPPPPSSTGIPLSPTTAVTFTPAGLLIR